MATGALVARQDDEVTAQQIQAWMYYGFPGSPSKKAKADEAAPPAAVGEVRYVVGWMADQMSRMNWRVLVNGEDTWAVNVKDGDETVTVRSEDVEDSSEPNSPLNASEDLLRLAIGWNRSVVRQVTTNLFVAGQLDYTAKNDDTWEVVSVIHPDRAELIKESVHSITGLWPHPADPSRPDAPLFGVLSVLSEMDWLSRLARSQSASRVSSRGIMGVAEGFEFANGGDFWREWEKAVRARMKDPTDVSPVILRGSQELTEASGRGMKGLSWLIPDFPYDARIDERMAELVKRLAYGLPIPPEILLGMQAQSRATAFQVEENSYRAHIEPPAHLVAQIAQDALSLVMDQEVEIVPDPTTLLTRRHSATDVKDAFDRGGVSFSYLRQVLAIPETAEPTEEDLRLFLLVNGLAGNADQDPGTQAAEEAVTAAVRPGGIGGTEAEPLDEDQLDELSEALAAVDNALRFELSGATQQATERARERIGAKARSMDTAREAIPREVTNAEVAPAIGLQGLQNLGVNVEDVVVAAIEPLDRWWRGRLSQAFEDVESILGEGIESGLMTEDIERSADSLAVLMVQHVIETLSSEQALPLSANDRQYLVSVAGGAA